MRRRLRFYVGHGYHDGSNSIYLADVEEFVEETGTWKPATSLPGERRSYGGIAVNLDQVEDAKGILYLEKALKHAAVTMTPQEDLQYYLEDTADYGTDVIRISNVECLNCWYGFIYTRNDSQYRLTETMRPTLEGLEVIYPALVDD